MHYIAKNTLHIEDITHYRSQYTIFANIINSSAEQNDFAMISLRTATSSVGLHNQCEATHRIEFIT